MKELYELKEKLCDELKGYGKKDMSAGTLDVVDKLSHTIKNLDKIIEKYEEEDYSGRYECGADRPSAGHEPSGRCPLLDAGAGRRICHHRSETAFWRSGTKLYEPSLGCPLFPSDLFCRYDDRFFCKRIRNNI